MPAPHLTDQAAPHLSDPGDDDPERLSVAERHPAWWQVYLHFADWETAEHTAATRLAPLLDDATGPGGSWWFIRKHPAWRLRLTARSDEPPGGAPPRDSLTEAFDQMVSEGVLERWWTGRYEPETTAFGGPDGMTAAHHLFAADSRAILHPIGDLSLGRREVSMLLCGALMRSAGLEPYEIGDVWAKVTHDRPLRAAVPPERLDRLTATVTTLLRTDTSPAGAAFGPSGPLAAAASWAQAFHTCGKTLARLARDGVLERGLREILAYHVIFHWNRVGLPARQQGLLARAARAAILGRNPLPATQQPANPPATAPRLATRLPDMPARLGRALRRFPLVSRPRLACPPLADRIQAIRDHADAAAAAVDPDERLDRACSAWNLAALVAADSGFPGLAADLSWQQYNILHARWPIADRGAIAALQPLVNLARLHGRARQPERMHQALTGIGHALDYGGSVLLHDTTITLDGLTAPGDTLHVRAWYQDVLAQDGTRALAATGDWAKAAAHAALHDPSPERLREARQTRIIALTLGGDYDGALAFLDSTDPADQDSPIDAVLRAHLDARAGRPYHDHLTRLLSALTATAKAAPAPVSSRDDSDDRPALVFRIRLAQAGDDLGTDPDTTASLWERLADETLQAEDGYAAREALAAPSCRAALTPERAEALTDLVHRGALSSTGPPIGLLADLSAFADPLQFAANVLTLLARGPALRRLE